MAGRPSEREGTDARGARVLVAAAAFFALGSIIHIADHFRRGTDSVTPQLLVAGYSAMVISAVVIALALLRHRLAPILSVAAGIGLAVGFTASHWLPTWSVLSDSFIEGDAELFSQFASLLEIAGALVLAGAGAYSLRRQPGPMAGSARAQMSTPS